MIEVRKLVKAGASSHTISLPKKWIADNSLNKGDSVYIKELSNNELSISPVMNSPSSPKEKEKLISTDNKELSTIQRELTSAYINNYSIISMSGSNIAGYAKEIKNIVNDFVALEVVEQNSKKFVVKDLLNLKEISVEKTIRRMDMIVRSMVSDVLEGSKDNQLESSINLRDEDINRLYFLMMRLLKGASQNSDIASEVGIENHQIFNYFQITIALENFADSCTNAVQLLRDLNPEKAESITELFRSIETNYLDVMKAIYKKDKVLADNVARRRGEILNQCVSIYEKQKELSTVEVLETLKSMTTQIGILARLVIDEDN